MHHFSERVLSGLLRHTITWSSYKTTSTSMFLSPLSTPLLKCPFCAQPVCTPIFSHSPSARLDCPQSPVGAQFRPHAGPKPAVRGRLYALHSLQSRSVLDDARAPKDKLALVHSRFDVHLMHIDELALDACAWRAQMRILAQTRKLLQVMHHCRRDGSRDERVREDHDDRYTQHEAQVFQALIAGCVCASVGLTAVSPCPCLQAPRSVATTHCLRQRSK